MNSSAKSFVSKAIRPLSRFTRKLVCSLKYHQRPLLGFLTFALGGLTVGDPVLRTGKPLSVELGPGNDRDAEHES
jgi:hypothetical protein